MFCRLLGLGKAFVETYLARPNTLVIAAVRDPDKETAKALERLQKGSGSKLLVVKIDSNVETDPTAAVRSIEAAGIENVDTIIANAGSADDFTRVDQVDVKVLRHNMETNAYGPLYLFQAFLPLLQKSKNPKFIGVGSPLGSIGGMDERGSLTLHMGLPRLRCIGLSQKFTMRTRTSSAL